MAVYNVDKSTGAIAETAGKYGSSNIFFGNLNSWNQLSTEEKKAYDHASITDSIDGETLFPANKVMMSDGTTSVEDRIDAHAIGGMTVIDGYTSNNRFLCPSDGYIRLNARLGSTIYLYLANSSTASGVLMLGVTSATEQNIIPIHVKAGAYAFCTDKSGNVDVVFLPLS